METNMTSTSSLQGVEYQYPWLAHGDEVKTTGFYRTDQLWDEFMELTKERSANTTFTIEIFLNWLYRKHILVPQITEVRNYLLQYHDMLDLALSVCGMVWEQFGGNTQLALEVYHDPEIEDEYLTVYVRQEQYDDDIMARIEDIWTEYGEAIADKSGWLLVTTDFGSPR